MDFTIKGFVASSTRHKILRLNLIKGYLDFFTGCGILNSSAERADSTVDVHERIQKLSRVVYDVTSRSSLVRPFHIPNATGQF